MKSNFLQITVAGLSTLLLSACVIDPNVIRIQPIEGYERETNDKEPKPVPTPSRGFVKKILYKNGQVSYFLTKNANGVRPDTARICLKNNTGQPKKMVWRKAPSTVNDLNAPNNGSVSCANLNVNQRVEWTFTDRNYPMKNDAMNLQSFGGTLVEFNWVKDY